MIRQQYVVIGVVFILISSVYFYGRGAFHFSEIGDSTKVAFPLRPPLPTGKNLQTIESIAKVFKNKTKMADSLYRESYCRFINRRYKTPQWYIPGF